MPARTRTEMHIGLDLALEVLNSSPTNRLDPAVKDYFLNRTINEFVKNVIDRANKPDETKRIPVRILTHGDILRKYNDIYTLIKVDDNLLPSSANYDHHIYTVPTDLLRFETSHSFVKPLACVTYLGNSIKPILALAGAGSGNVNTGVHYYIVTFLYSTTETNPLALGVNTITVADASVNGRVSISGVPLGATGCTGRKIYRTVAGGNWTDAKLLTTLSDNTTTTYTDNIADSALGASLTFSDNKIENVLPLNYDITSFNNNPFGGKRKYIATSLESAGIKLYHLNRYEVTRFGIVYIKKPAVLSDVPTNCDLPDSVHDTIVDETAKYLAAIANSENYQQLLMEAKQQTT